MAAQPKSAPPRRRLNWLLAATHLAACVPLGRVLLSTFGDPGTVNPIQDLTFGTGLPALIFLLLSLAVTPANALLGWRWALPLRRWLGLYAFFYAAAHLLIFVGLDYGFDAALIYEAIFEKRYALVGFLAFLILSALALTSTRGWQRRLGKAWKQLHRLVYAAAGLAVVHFVWLVKADVREPLAYGAVLGLLLLARVPAVRRRLAGLRASAGRQIRPQPPEAAPDAAPAVPSDHVP